MYHPKCVRVYFTRIEETQASKMTLIFIGSIDELKDGVMTILKPGNKEIREKGGKADDIDDEDRKRKIAHRLSKER